MKKKQKEKTPAGKILRLFLFCIVAAAVMYKVANLDWNSPKRGQGYIVCLDAGHGGEDPGAVYGEYREADDTLAMTLLVKKYLEKQGCTVIMTRIEDTYLKLSERAALANQAGADAMVSIHRNVQGIDPSAHGVEAWIHSAKPNNAVQLSSCILSRLEKTQTFDVSRGVRSGTADDASSNYLINVEASMASCILELGFISNEEDNGYFHKQDTKIAKAIANGILDSLETNGE